MQQTAPAFSCCRSSWQSSSAEEKERESTCVFLDVTVRGASVGLQSKFFNKLLQYCAVHIITHVLT